MPTTQQPERNEREARQEPDRLNALIGERVIRALGEPSDWHQVQVRRLWADRYRANVFIGEGTTSARIAHSYFLVVDGDGGIIASTPEITKRY